MSRSTRCCELFAACLLQCGIMTSCDIAFAMINEVAGVLDCAAILQHGRMILICTSRGVIMNSGSYGSIP